MTMRKGIVEGLSIKGSEIVRNAIISLSKYGLITFSREQTFKSSKYQIHFFKPEKNLQQLYNLGDEILVVTCSNSMKEFRSRTMDFIDYILTTREEFKNRLDKITCIIIDNNNNIVEMIDRLRQEVPDSRLIIPFCYNELQNGINEESLNDRFRHFLYVADLFGIATPLKDDSMFFGKDRADLISDLYGKYKQGEPGGLFGLRRIGKTSVLNLLSKRIKQDGGAVVYFDCSRYHHKRWNYFLMDIIDRVIEEFGDEDNDNNIFPAELIAKVNESRYSEENATNSFERDLSNVYKHIGKIRILLIFDEIEKIGFHTSASDHWRTGNDAVFFWESLRSIYQMDNSLFCYLIAGVNPMCIELPTINGNDNPIFGSFNPIYMKLFDDDDVYQMVTSIGGHLGLVFDNQVCSKLVEDYGGHPFLTRQVCSRINKYILEKKENRPYAVSKYDYEIHAYDFKSDMKNVIEQILDVIETSYAREYNLLKRLALNGRDSFKKENIGGDNSIQHLLGYCLIDKHRSEYFLRINSIKQYLCDKYLYDSELDDQVDKRNRINIRRDRIETKIRSVIWYSTCLKYGRKTRDRIIGIIEKRTNDSGQVARLKARKEQDVMEELYFSQLGEIIEKDWKDYEKIFIDKKKFSLCFEIVNESRNVASHSKSLSDDDEVEYNYAFKFFEECLENW